MSIKNEGSLPIKLKNTNLKLLKGRNIEKQGKHFGEKNVGDRDEAKNRESSRDKRALRDGLSRNPESRPSDGCSSGSEQRLYELFSLDTAFCSFKW